MKAGAIGNGLAMLIVAASVSLHAHHSLTAEYDPKAPITLIGRITKVEWTNPHAFLNLECKTEDGALEHWRVELGSPAVLSKAEIPREMVAIDSVVTIKGLRAKTAALRAWGMEITFPDGSTRQVNEEMEPDVPYVIAPPTFLERLMSSQPLLPYFVLAVPVVVLAAGLLILRRRRRRSVPQ